MVDVEQITVDKSQYHNGKITGQRKISEYSVIVGIPREVLIDDRTNARYIHEESIRNNVNYDLVAGFKFFTDKGVFLKKELPLHTLCEWAKQQSGATLKEVFEGADFASWRGTMKRIANTLNCRPFKPRGNERKDIENKNKALQRESWNFVAQDFGGIIILCENKVYDGDKKDLATYTGFKFEQYVTTASPGGTPDTKSPVDNRPTFERMVRSDLTVGDATLKLCCGAEIDALINNNDPCEVKTVFCVDPTDRRLGKILQSEIVGVNHFVVGYKIGKVWEKNVKVVKVEKHTLADINSGVTKIAASQCYAFLFDVLSKIKKFLQSNEACRVSFNPSLDEGTIEVVTIKKISKEEANFTGNGFNEEFRKRFSI